MEQTGLDQIQNLIKKLVDKDDLSQTKTLSRKVSGAESNKEIEELDISDVFGFVYQYLHLLAHQKKHINEARWHKLKRINQSGMMEQQDFKYFLAVASQGHYRRLEHPGYYQLLLDRKHEYPPAFFSAIEKDVPRTLPPGHCFSEPLRNVLTAYAIRNPSLGYCQGMNYLVAFLLINSMSAQQTFWVLACLVQNCLPDDYFKDLTTISITSCIFEDILEVAVPEFRQLLLQTGMDASALLVPWLVCLFAKNFINSVSAYLLGYFMLESQRKNPGFVLLKIAVSIIAAILNKDEDLPFSKDFKTLKDCLQLKVFQLSLPEMQQALETVPLNYNVYVEVESYYRKEKMEARSNMLKSRSKKMALPPCNPDYPVCLHRIQIQKKLGAVQNAMIFKNGLTIKEQLCENYLQQTAEAEPANVSYVHFSQCAIGRQEHVCHLNQLESHSKVDMRGRTLEREVTHKIELIDSQQEGNQSEEQSVRLSTYQERFREVSQYFQIDQQFQQEEFQDKKCEEELKKEFQQFSIEKPKPTPKQTRKKVEFLSQKEIEEKKGLKFYLSSVRRKVSDAIGQLQRSRKSKKSQTSIQFPNLSHQNSQHSSPQKNLSNSLPSKPIKPRMIAQKTDEV